VESNGANIAVPEPGALGYKLGGEYFVIDYPVAGPPGSLLLVSIERWKYLIDYKLHKKADLVLGQLFCLLCFLSK